MVGSKAISPPVQLTRESPSVHTSSLARSAGVTSASQGIGSSWPKAASSEGVVMVTCGSFEVLSPPMLNMSQLVNKAARTTVVQDNERSLPHEIP